MKQIIRQLDTKRAVVLSNRAALFIRCAKKGAIHNLLLERHYFRLNLAEHPLAPVVMGIRGKTAQNKRGD